MAFNSNYHDTGLFGVYAVADKDAPIDDLAWAIMQVRTCTRLLPLCKPAMYGAGILLSADIAEC